jgi:hypothetical protein
VRFVVLVKECGRDIRHISSRVTFTGNIDLEVLNAKYRLEVLKKFHKVLSSLLLSGSSRSANGITSPYRLVDPVTSTKMLMIIEHTIRLQNQS